MKMKPLTIILAVAGVGVVGWYAYTKVTTANEAQNAKTLATSVVNVTTTKPSRAALSGASYYRTR